MTLTNAIQTAKNMIGNKKDFRVYVFFVESTASWYTLSENTLQEMFTSTDRVACSEMYVVYLESKKTGYITNRVK